MTMREKFDLAEKHDEIIRTLGQHVAITFGVLINNIPSRFHPGIVGQLEAICLAKRNTFSEREKTVADEIRDISIDEVHFRPLVERIVEPHGRLIDANKFFEDVTESAIMTDDFKEAFAIWLETQETVIPASDQEADI